MTRKCFVIACRVMPEPTVNRTMDVGPSLLRRRIKLRRVRSARTANSGAEFRRCDAERELSCFRKVLLNECEDDRPTLLVLAERFGAARERNLIES